MNFRKITKAFLAVVLSCLILCSVTLFALAQGVVIKGEPDGQNKSTVIDEHFYSGSLEPNFTSDTVTVATDSYGMHFAGAYHYGSALVLTAYKLKSYNRFTFSIDMLGTNDGFIYCGFGGADTNATVTYYDFNLCVSKGVTALYKMGGMDSWTAVGNGIPLNNALEVGKTTDFAITLEKVSGNDYKVTFEILEEGEPIITTDYNGSTIRMDNPDGYFCMWGGLNEQFDIRNFKVYDSKTNLAFEDNFENLQVEKNQDGSIKRTALKIDECEALCIQYSADFAGENYSFRAWFISRGGYIYTMLYTAKTAAFESHLQEAEAMAENLLFR